MVLQFHHLLHPKLSVKKVKCHFENCIDASATRTRVLGRGKGQKKLPKLRVFRNVYAIDQCYGTEVSVFRNSLGKNAF